MNDWNPAPLLDLATDLLDEISHNPAAYYPGTCRDCGDACDAYANLCEDCQEEEQPHEAPEAQPV